MWRSQDRTDSDLMEDKVPDPFAPSSRLPRSPVVTRSRGFQEGQRQVNPAGVVLPPPPRRLMVKFFRSTKDRNRGFKLQKGPGSKEKVQVVVHGFRKRWGAAVTY